MKRTAPQDQVFWYLKREEEPACHKDFEVDVVIVGGGMAGLSAAQAFSKRGKKVAVLEQYYCGAGASGKSSGFITPNAEVSFTGFSNRYNPDAAHAIWDCITQGVEDIRANILENNFPCDYAPQDTLMLATSENALKVFKTEHENLVKFGYKTVFLSADQVRKKIGSDKYYGGMTYEDTFGITSYDYCQELKQHLKQAGVQVFENATVTAIDDHTVTTPHASITAQYIVICIDRFMPELGLLKKEVYHAQTFLMISEVLTEEQIRSIFPEEKLLVWDSELVYNYFRVTPHNQLLLGGGSVGTTYSRKAQYDNQAMFLKLTNYFEEKFPGRNIQFKQMWPGLIGISKDIAPLAGSDKDRPYVYYIAGAAGLPIAAALGRYSAEHLLEGRTDLDAYFSPYRRFKIDGALQSILGTPLTFALCNNL